jgi:phospholipid/cholesterol/gamma-HCH transport system substrate-binding protein
VALAALLAAAAIVAILLLGIGSTYEVRADFLNAGQLVKGNDVMVAGTPIGQVTDLKVSPDGHARVTMQITETPYTPLRKGTKLTVRAASLSGVANRYVDLQLPPGDASTTGTYKADEIIPTTETLSAVDLDQLFDVFGSKERKGLRAIIQGGARMDRGTAAQARAGLAYLNPFVAANTRLFQELTRDTPALRRFLVKGARLMGDLAEKRNDLTSLVDNLATTSEAIAQPPNQLARSVSLLPPFMRRANTTFVNLRSTLDHLDPLVEESKPVAKKLRPFFATLRPFARDAVPTVRDLSAIIRSPGKGNDLIDLMKGAPPLAKIAIGPVRRNGKTRKGAFPETVKALGPATKSLAYARPYAVDLTGWFDDFSHSGVYDANGGTSRVAPVLSAFSFQQNGTLATIPAELRSPLLFGGKSGGDTGQITTGQYNRCPGGAARPARDGSNPWKPSKGYPCDPSQYPPGR